jgi:hypothetical protein
MSLLYYITFDLHSHYLMSMIFPHLMFNHICKVVTFIVDLMILCRLTVRKVHIVCWRYVGYLTNSHLSCAYGLCYAILQQEPVTLLGSLTCRFHFDNGEALV